MENHIKEKLFNLTRNVTDFIEKNGKISINDNISKLEFKTEIISIKHMETISISEIEFTSENQLFPISSIRYQTEHEFGPDVLSLISDHHLVLKLIRIQMGERWEDNPIPFSDTQEAREASQYLGSPYCHIDPTKLVDLMMVNLDIVMETEEIDVDNLEREHIRISQKYMKMFPYDEFISKVRLYNSL